MLSVKIAREIRKDGTIISTIKSYDEWYGKYETAVSFEFEQTAWKILEGYPSKEEALKGHKRYCNMSTNELEKIEGIG